MANWWLGNAALAKSLGSQKRFVLEGSLRLIGLLANCL
jgi:hypothetical protein